MNCGKAPASFITVGSAGSFVIWWTKKKHSNFYCGICAESVYLEHQKRSGRQGWFGPISFVYTVFSLLRNRIAIASHRREVPLVEHEGQLFQRPKAKIRRDLPTVLIAGVVLLLVTAIIVNWQVTSARNASAIVDDATATSPWSSLDAGDCIVDLEDLESTTSLMWTDCSNAHKYQIFAVGKSQLSAWSEARLGNEADEICSSSTDKIDREYLSTLTQEPEVIYYYPTEVSWAEGDRGLACVLGNDKYKLVRSVLTD